MKQHDKLPGRVLVLISIMSLLLLAGCGEPNDPASPSELPYEIISNMETYGFADSFYNLNDTLYVAEGYAGIGIYDYTSFSSPSLIQHIDVTVPEINFAHPIGNVAVLPDWDIMVVNHDTWVSFLSISETLPLSWLPAGSGIAHQMISISRKDTVIMQEYDNDFHFRDVFQVMLADRGSDDGLLKYTYFVDSTETIDGWQPELTRVNVGSKIFLHGKPPQGISSISNLDTVAVGFGELGVAVVIVDGSYPNTEPVFLSTVNTPGEAQKLTYAEGMIYVADGFNGLAIIDAGDLNAPQLVSSWTEDGLDHVEDVAYADGVCAVMDRYDGVVLVDVSDPEAPEKLGMYEVRDVTSVAFLNNTHLAITSQIEGITILRIKDLL